MKLVIEISEEDYNNIEPFLNGETIKGGLNLFKVLEIIKNGKPLPQSATNGDMIKFMFPDAQIDYHEKSEFVEEYITVYPKDWDTCQDYPKYWWDLPYKEEGAE